MVKSFAIVEWIVLVVLCFGLWCGGFIVGREIARRDFVANYSYWTPTPANYSVEGVLSIIDAGIQSHQYYIDHPEQCNDSTGNVSVNQLWVDNYNYLRGMLLRR